MEVFPDPVQYALPPSFSSSFHSGLLCFHRCLHPPSLSSFTVQEQGFFTHQSSLFTSFLKSLPWLLHLKSRLLGPAWSGVSCQPQFLPPSLTCLDPLRAPLICLTTPLLPQGLWTESGAIPVPTSAGCMGHSFSLLRASPSCYLTSHHSVFTGPPFIWYLRVWLVFLTVLLSPSPYFICLPPYPLLLLMLLLVCLFYWNVSASKTERGPLFFTIVSLVPPKVACYVTGAQGPSFE